MLRRLTSERSDALNKTFPHRTNRDHVHFRNGQEYFRQRKHSTRTGMTAGMKGTRNNAQYPSVNRAGGVQVDNVRNHEKRVSK